MTGMAWRHGFWVRITRGGWGIGVLNHNHQRPLFSERYAGQHGVPKMRRLHIGPWCIRVLRPLYR